MNGIEFSKKPANSEKSALLKFGVFQQNRPNPAGHAAEIQVQRIAAMW